ncbi:MAG: fibronectin type III domain-containing protein, partial [Firmicutes bacterium]|nr:fibronectin type III domain-containing protein [Bacillota bacterium]
CGVPGELRPRRPLVPLAVADLTAHQQGDVVRLQFTLPERATDGRVLAAPPDIELYRWFPEATGALEPSQVPATPQRVVPRAEVSRFRVGGQVILTDPLPLTVLQGAAGVRVAYLVRTRTGARHSSQESNVVVVRVYPVPEPPQALAATVTEVGVELRWPAVERTTGGAPLPGPVHYRIYRAAPPEPAEVPLGMSPAPYYRDAQAEFGRVYRYRVTAVAHYADDAVESAPSAAATVTPEDRFAPVPPSGLVAVFVPATAAAPAAVELSWSASDESDLAGYHVYRSEQPESLGMRLSAELLVQTTFRDAQLTPGRRYYYRVTAVDRAGNESAASAPVAMEIPREERPEARGRPTEETTLWGARK